MSSRPPPLPDDVGSAHPSPRHETALAIPITARRESFLLETPSSILVFLALDRALDFR